MEASKRLMTKKKLDKRDKKPSDDWLKELEKQLKEQENQEPRLVDLNNSILEK